LERFTMNETTAEDISRRSTLPLINYHFSD